MVETKVDVSARKNLPPGSHWPFAARSDCIRAPDADRERLMAEVDALAAKFAEAERERDAAKAEVIEYMNALRDVREVKRSVEGDALLWRYSIADGGRSPLLVRVNERRRAAERDLTAAQATITQLRAETDAVKAAVEAERESCAKIADTGMLVPPDGGSPTDGECDVALGIAAAIRARSSAPPVPAPIDEAVALRTKLATAREALGWFLADDRFQVAVGGNPNVVERMLNGARKAYEDTAI